MKSTSCVATLLAFACALAGGVKLAEAADPIRFGLVVPLSGPVAVFGVPEKQAVDLMTEEVNGKGGILGRKLEIVAYDDQAQSEKTANFTTRLIENDNVDVILGPSTTGTSMAAIPIAQDAGVPLMALSGGLPITEPVKKWVFRFSLSDQKPAVSSLITSRITAAARSRSFRIPARTASRCKEIAPPRPRNAA